MFMLLASMLTLLRHGHAVASTSSDDQLKNQIIRRHDSKDGLSEALLDSAGEVKFRRRVANTTAANEVSNSFCNHDFVRGTVNTNQCDCGDGCVPVMTEYACRHAAEYLKTNGEQVSAAQSFVKAVNEGGLAILPFPKGCYIHGGEIFLNPTEPEPKDGWQGTPLCQRQLFPASLDGCTGAFEAITTREDCLLAADCAVGLDGCKMPDFEHAASKQFESAERPKGCFLEPKTECFNFNHVDSESGGNIEGQRVCKLKKVSA